MAEENGEDSSVMRIGKRCYVGNLAWKTSWQDLKDKFRDVGNVVYANVMRDDGGRSKGWGIVEFETPEEVRFPHLGALVVVYLFLPDALTKGVQRALDIGARLKSDLVKLPKLKRVFRKSLKVSSAVQAVTAVNTFNGTDLAGRKIMVREDREDRDVKQYNRDNGIEEQGPVAGREGGGGGRGRGGRRGGRGGRGRGRGPPRAQQDQQDFPSENNGSAANEGSSGTQVVVQGIPWKYTWKELRPMFEECGTIDRAEVVYGRDGRSRGYGTVKFDSTEAAQGAIDKFHGTDCEGRTLTVKLDQYA